MRHTGTIESQTSETGEAGRGEKHRGDVLHAGVKRDPTKFSNSRNAGPHSTFLAAAPRSDA